jgi:hypothetical protein
MSEGVCGSIHDTVPAIKPLDKCPAGNCQWYREIYPIIIEKGKYYLPTLYYMSTNMHVEYLSGMPMTVRCATISQRYPFLNFVNTRLSAALGENDTVLVQRGRVAVGKTRGT